MLSSASNKAKLFPENFSKNSDLDDLGISLTALHSRTNLLKLQYIPVTPKFFKKAIIHLDSLKVCGHDCIQEEV